MSLGVGSIAYVADYSVDVTARGRRAVVVIDAEEYERLATPKPQVPFVAFLESLHMEGLDLSREPDIGREVEL
jgi:antitoxin Phd